MYGWNLYMCYIDGYLGLYSVPINIVVNFEKVQALVSCLMILVPLWI